MSCDWSVKDNDNESNSQRTLASSISRKSCDWSVKDNDNESNSQHTNGNVDSVYVVIGLSKIMIMKAIHNFRSLYVYCIAVVIGLSKIMIMKAIHNCKIMSIAVNLL